MSIKTLLPCNMDFSTENLPFCYNRHRIKAIVLGADPGNTSNHGKTVDIKVAFAIGSGDYRYFEAIRKNLERIGLSITDVYIQNLITVNSCIDTSKNAAWNQLADEHIIRRMEEFKLIDPSFKLPVLVTAEKIFKYLANEKLAKAEKLYTDQSCQPIPANRNKMCRLVFPFFRNSNYNLDNASFIEYRNILVNFFK